MRSARLFPALLGLLLFQASAALPLSAQEPASGRRMEHLTLQDAIQRALARNYLIQVSGYDAAIASARFSESLGKFDPALVGEYISSESENPQLANSLTGIRPAPTRTESDTYDLSLRGLLPTGLTYRLGASSTNTRGTFNLFADNHSTFAGVSAAQPLLRDFGFGPTLASIRIARRNRAISEWQFRQSVMDTVTRVITAYNELNFAKASLRSALRSRELAAQLLADNEKRFAVGRISEFDVTSARSRLANREEGILFAERRVRDAENLVKQLITDERTPALLDYGLEIEPPAIPPPVVVDAALDFRLALEKRPDYQQAQLALQSSDIGFRLQRNQLLPRVDLVGSYGYAGFDSDFGASRGMVRNQDHPSYSYGVAVSIPLTFTAERGRYRAARFEQQQAGANLQRIEQNIVVSVGNAAGQIETAQKRVETSKFARELGQQTLDAEEKRLRAGTSTTFFVSQQQEILSSLEISELRARTDYLNALAEYDRQLGLTLEKLNITVEPPG